MPIAPNFPYGRTRITKPIRTEGHELEVKESIIPQVYDYIVDVTINDRDKIVWNINSRKDPMLQKAEGCAVYIKDTASREVVNEMTIFTFIKERHFNRAINLDQDSYNLVSQTMTNIENILQKDRQRAHRSLF